MTKVKTTLVTEVPYIQATGFGLIARMRNPAVLCGKILSPVVLPKPSGLEGAIFWSNPDFACARCRKCSRYDHPWI